MKFFFLVWSCFWYLLVTQVTAAGLSNALGGMAWREGAQNLLWARRLEYNPSLRTWTWSGLSSRSPNVQCYLWNLVLFCLPLFFFFFWHLTPVFNSITMGHLGPFAGTSGSLPSPLQLYWLSLVRWSVHGCQFMSVVLFSGLIVALCFIFRGKTVKTSTAGCLPLDLALTHFKNF